MNQANAIFYEELKKHLKEKNERIENDLFKAILSACRLVNAGQGITSACDIAGIGSVATHYEGKVLRPYVKAVMKEAGPRIEKAIKSFEKYKKREEDFKCVKGNLEQIMKEWKDDDITVSQKHLKLILSFTRELN